jgi:hypothetical protein
MKTVSLISLLFIVLLAGCATPTGQLTLKRPARWDAEMITDAGDHRRYFVQIHASGPGAPEFIVKRGESGAPLSNYGTLCVTPLTPADLKLLYDAVSQTFQQFQFTTDSLPGRRDTGYTTVQLRVGARFLTAGFGSIANSKDLPRSLQLVQKFADDRVLRYSKPKPTDH